MQADLVQAAKGGSDALMEQTRVRGVQLVLMSASAAPAAVMEGIELGAVDFLEKPVSPHKLRNIWQHVVRKVQHLPADLLCIGCSGDLMLYARADYGIHLAAAGGHLISEGLCKDCDADLRLFKSCFSCS